MPKVHLNKDEDVKGLAVTDGQVDYFDQNYKGLMIRVSPGGTKAWRAVYYISGKAKTHKLGRFPIMKLKAAKEACGKFLENPQEALRKERQGTFREKVNEFIDEDAKQNRTWYETAKLLGLQRDRKAIKVADKAERHRLENDPAAFIAVKGGPAHKWGDWSITDLAEADYEVTEYLRAIKRRGAGVAANRALAALRRFFNWCVEVKILKASPLAGIGRLVKETPRDRVLTDDELKAVWKAIEQAPEWPWRPYFKLLLLTAQRRGEVANMERSEIDLERKVWTLPRAKTKADREHTVPLSDEAVSILKELPKFSGPYVFSTTGGERPVQGQEKAIMDIRKQAGIAHWTIHDIRRTVTTGMAAFTAPHVLSAIINHAPASTQGVTAIYNRHKYEDEKRTAMDAWARRIMSIVSDEKQGSNVIDLVARQ